MPRIMIVDDDATIQIELEKYLTHLNHDVVGVAHSGDMAVRMALDLKPDLILMDVVMQGKIDGISAAEKIRGKVDAAILFVTGFDDREYIGRAKQVEPFGYVMKPFDRKEIGGTIEIALHKRKLELELKKANLELKKEIEERKKTERALQEIEERLNLVIKGSNDAPWDWDLISNELYYSTQWWHQLGYTPNELPVDAALWEQAHASRGFRPCGFCFQGCSQERY